MKSDAWFRVRAACCDESGLSREELEAHADAVAAVAEQARCLGPLVWRFDPPDDERSAA